MQHSIFPSAEVIAQDETIQLKDAKQALADIIEPMTFVKIDTEGCVVAILERLSGAFNNLKIIYL